MRNIFLLVTVMALTTWTTGCQKCQGPSSPLLMDAAAPPNFEKESSAKVQSVPSSLIPSAVWDKATKTHDAIDLASLADFAGAAGLLHAMEVGGERGKTALLAIPYAKQAPLAYRRLAEIALQTRGETQHQVLSVIEQIALRHRITMEPLDPEGTEMCARAMREIATSTSIDGKNRNLALSITRLPPFDTILRNASENPSATPTPSGS